MSDRMPFVAGSGGGGGAQGVQVQRKVLPVSGAMGYDRRPAINTGGGFGVQQQVEEVNGTGRLSAPFPYY